MIISHKHRFIFLKTRKTAGTSIDMALSERCGPEDVIAPVNPHDEGVKNQTGSRTSQNFEVPSVHWTMKDLARLLMRAKGVVYTEHMSAASVKRRVGRKVWNEYYKFCVERDPFDKAISLYYWRTRDLVPRPSFLEFLRGVDDRSLSNFHIYSIKGSLVMDEIVRYESLNSGLKLVTDRLGMNPLVLSNAKSSYRQEDGDVLMSPEAVRIIGRVCRREIELFDYTWDGERYRDVGAC